jgi:hypothetical protein
MVERMIGARPGTGGGGITDLHTSWIAPPDHTGDRPLVALIAFSPNFERTLDRAAERRAMR